MTIDRELSDLFSEQNFRLTETPGTQAMEGIEDKLADHLDGPAGDLVAAVERCRRARPQSLTVRFDRVLDAIR
ncbi:hypothetical protein C8039_10800 [Halogeometricum sp. wsp3]|nr:hypothetical protein C8039_10800 [Halogeometricum sp. wsp3]